MSEYKDPLGFWKEIFCSKARYKKPDEKKNSNIQRDHEDSQLNAKNVSSVGDTHINFDFLPSPLFQEKSKRVDYGQSLTLSIRCQLCK